MGLESLDKRNNHTDVVKGQYDNLAAYKRGKGGRGSFNGIVATVFGCSGYVGKYVTQRLGNFYELKITIFCYTWKAFDHKTYFMMLI